MWHNDSARYHRLQMGGFTLVEVIIVTVLVSLIMLGLLSALGTLGTTASRLEARTERSDEAWLVGDLLRFSLSRSVSRLKQTLPDGKKSVFFHGAPQEVVWLGVMPARHGAGGLYHFRLAPATDFPPRLVLQYAPFISQDEVPDIAGADSHILVGPLEGLRIAYQARPKEQGQEGEWVESWEDTEQLPVRVRLDITAENRVWPPLFVSIAAADSGGGGDGRIVAGPPVD